MIQGHDDVVHCIKKAQNIVALAVDNCAVQAVAAQEAMLLVLEEVSLSENVQDIIALAIDNHTAQAVTAQEAVLLVIGEASLGEKA